MSKRKYKVFGYNVDTHYFDLESSMREHVMISRLSGSNVNVFDQHERKFIIMTEGTKALRKLVTREKHND